jgi:polyribonucleotide nucleotidyltransferase
MGLILEPDGSYVVLSDIQGSEDSLGDMDFKVRSSACLEIVHAVKVVCVLVVLSGI